MDYSVGNFVKRVTNISIEIFTVSLLEERHTRIKRTYLCIFKIHSKNELFQQQSRLT